MSKKMKLELDRKGIKKLLMSRDMGSLMKSRAKRIASAAGPGHEVTVEHSKDRARASVRTATPAARREEFKNRRLTRAVQAGR